MKTLNALFALVAIAIVAIGCETPTAPGDPAGAYNKTVTRRFDPIIQPIALPHGELVDPVIELTSPSLDISALRTGGYRLAFTASAGGCSTSPSVTALGSLRSVTFQIYAGDNRLLDSRMTTDIPASGVMNSVTHEVSLNAMAVTEWYGNAGADGYVVMTVRSDKGICIKQQTFPVAIRPATIGNPIITHPLDLMSSMLPSVGRTDRAPDVRFGLPVEK